MTESTIIGDRNIRHEKQLQDKTTNIITGRDKGTSHNERSYLTKTEQRLKGSAANTDQIRKSKKL